jgi:hypothetical protein
VKLQHRVPDFSRNMTGKLDPDYEREVERSTTKLEVAYARAQRRLEAIEKRKQKLEHKIATTKTKKSKVVAEKELKKLLSEYVAREEELRTIVEMMTSTPAGSLHRGIKSFRPLPLN